MNENEKLNERIEESDNSTDTSVDYIAAIKELKENSVDKSLYDQVRSENKRLLKSLVDGERLDMPQAHETIDLDKLRDETFNNENQTNLQYITNVLKLRNELMERGERDPFLPVGSYTPIEPGDEAKAQRVADALQYCVDYSEGDSSVFTNELQRLLVDVNIPRKKR